MLKFAIQHREDLAHQWIAAIALPENRYLMACGYNGFNMEIKEDDYYKLQMVSVAPSGQVIGFFACCFDRTCKKAYDIEVINFSFHGNPVFARDLHSFLDGLFVRYGMNKVEFNVVIGNPAEAQYDRVIKRYGGLVVGVRHETCCLVDGTLCDMKMYELSRGNYLNTRRRKLVT